MTEEAYLHADNISCSDKSALYSPWRAPTPLPPSVKHGPLSWLPRGKCHAMFNVHTEAYTSRHPVHGPLFFSPRSPCATTHNVIQFLFISDVMESFSAPPSTPNPSGEDSAALADGQETPVTTPVPSPGNSSANPASLGSSFASGRRRSSYAPSSPGGKNEAGGGVAGRVALEPRCSKLPSPAARSTTAQPNTSAGLDPQDGALGSGEDLLSGGGGNEGGGRSGEGVGKASASRRLSSPPPSKIDTGSLLSPGNTGRSPIGYAR